MTKKSDKQKDIEINNLAIKYAYGKINKCIISIALIIGVAFISTINKMTDNIAFLALYTLAFGLCLISLIIHIDRLKDLKIEYKRLNNKEYKNRDKIR